MQGLSLMGKRIVKARGSRWYNKSQDVHEICKALEDQKAMLHIRPFLEDLYLFFNTVKEVTLSYEVL